MMRPRLGSLSPRGRGAPMPPMSSTTDLPHISSTDLLKYSGLVTVTLYFGNLDSSVVFFAPSRESQSTLSLYEHRFFPLTLDFHEFNGFEDE